MSESIKGPVLITGCSSGLGQAVALRLAEAGYVTIATARDTATLSPLVARGCEAMALDVTDEAQRQSVVAAVEAKYGPVGILVNNAGFGQYGAMEEVSPDELFRSFDTNVFGLVRMSQLVVPGMRKAGRGRIVNVSSLAGRVSAPGGGVYHMTKHAVEAFADAMRPEIAPFGVKMVNVLPGPFVSPYRDKVLEGIPDKGATSPYANYNRNVATYMLRFLDPKRFGTMPLEKVARAVFRAATAPRPRPRYSVGFWAHFGPVGRYVAGDRVVDWWMARDIPHDRLKT
jgi:NAD(P)-dependent dehydrogenase (short-subunit alcohol dehydrogenase family)